MKITYCCKPDTIGFQVEYTVLWPALLIQQEKGGWSSLFNQEGVFFQHVLFCFFALKRSLIVCLISVTNQMPITIILVWFGTSKWENVHTRVCLSVCRSAVCLSRNRHVHLGYVRSGKTNAELSIKWVRGKRACYTRLNLQSSTVAPALKLSSIGNKVLWAQSSAVTITT